MRLPKLLMIIGVLIFVIGLAYEVYQYWQASRGYCDEKRQYDVLFSYCHIYCVEYSLIIHLFM